MPTYNENFALLRFGGTAWAGIESWSCGLKLKHLGGDEVGAMQDEAKATIDEVRTLTIAYLARATSKFHFETKLNWIKLNVIDASTGKYAFPHDPVYVEGLTQGGNGGAGIPQVALCVTMRGDFERGTAAFGRWFIPASYAALETDGQLTTAFAQECASSACAYLAGLATIDSGLGPDAWAPWLYGSGESGNRDSAVRQVQVGKVYDTQRRRRENLLEDYVTGTGYPPA